MTDGLTLNPAVEVRTISCLRFAPLTVIDSEEFVPFMYIIEPEAVPVSSDVRLIKVSIFGPESSSEENLSAAQTFPCIHMEKTKKEVIK